MKGIHAAFVPDPQRDEQAAGHAKGKTKDIDGRKAFAFAEIAPGNEEVVFKHVR